MARKKLRTPLILPREQGGTFYTFSSALEDVGLNINELHNKVEMSHYVLLDLPPFEDVRPESISSLEQSHSGDNAFATIFQDYALNFETVLRNNDDYDFSESLTVSERVFWKFLKKYFGFKVTPTTPEDSSVSGYFKELDDSSTYSSIVKGFGSISAGAQRSDSYGIYNETFVQIPSSFGQMPVLFKTVSDKNYHAGEYSSSVDLSLESLYKDNIEYVSDNDKLSDLIPVKAFYDDNIGKSYTINNDDSNDSDELCIELSCSELREYYNDSNLNYDNLAIDSKYVKEDKYNFNAVLVYYSIYDSTGKNVLATNAYGILLLDNSAPYAYKNESISNGLNVKTYKFNSIEKYRTTASSSGNSYSFRLNIKASNVYSREITIDDNSTPAYEMSTEFTDVIKNLTNAIDILRSNANTIKVLASEHESIKNFAASALDKVDDLEKDVINLKNGTSRNLVVETLSAQHISTSTIDSSFDFYNNNGQVCGYVDDGKLKMDSSIITNTVDASIINADKVNTKTIGNSSDILFATYGAKDSSIIGKIGDKGIYTEHSFFIPNKDFKNNEVVNIPGNDDDIDKILNAIKIYKDASSNILYLNTKNVSETGINISDLLNPESNYINIINLLILIVKRLQSRMGSIADIDSRFNNYVEKIDSTVEDLKTTIDDQTDNISNLKDYVGSIKDLVDDIDSSIKIVSDSISDQDDMNKFFDSKFASINESLEDLNNKQKEQNLKYSDLEKHITMIDGSLGLLDTSVNTRFDSIGDEIKEGVKDYTDEKFNNIYKEIEEIKNDASTRYSDTSVLINDLYNSLNDLDTSVNVKIGEIGAKIKDGVKDYNSKINNINNDISTIKSDSSIRYSDISTNIIQIKDDLKTLDSSINDKFGEVKEANESYTNNAVENISKHLESALELRDASITSIKDYMNEVGDSLIKIDSSLNDLTTSTTLLQTNYESIDASITSIISNQKSLSDKVNENSKNIDSIKADIKADSSSSVDSSGIDASMKEP